MALVGRRDGRNFGYGRQLGYAGPQALKDMSGGGHYGTVKAHCDRWQAFVKWCRSEQGPGINDARQIDRKVLADYAAYLRDVVRRGDLAVSTALNRLSSVNRTMAALRGDQCVKLPSPSKALGMQRTGFDTQCLRAKIANTLSRSSMRFAAMTRDEPQRLSCWREPPACACVMPSWLTCHGLAVRLKPAARSTSRTARKAAAREPRHPAGFR